jgi:hypothetical protein
LRSSKSQSLKLISKIPPQRNEETNISSPEKPGLIKNKKETFSMFLKANFKNVQAITYKKNSIPACCNALYS